VTLSSATQRACPLRLQTPKVGLRVRIERTRNDFTTQRTPSFKQHLCVRRLRKAQRRPIIRDVLAEIWLDIAETVRRLRQTISPMIVPTS
jgi:hypothetical protein